MIWPPSELARQKVVLGVRQDHGKVTVKAVYHFHVVFAGGCFLGGGEDARELVRGGRYEDELRGESHERALREPVGARECDGGRGQEE